MLGQRRCSCGGRGGVAAWSGSGVAGLGWQCGGPRGGGRTRGGGGSDAAAAAGLVVAGEPVSGQIRLDLSPGTRLVAQGGGRGSSWTRIREGTAAVAGLLLGSGTGPAAGGPEQSLGVPAWMWATTAWWWPMAVVWVGSWWRLDFFGVCLSVSALGDLRFLSPSFRRYLHRRVGPLPAVPSARLAPGDRTELVSRPAAGPSPSRARQQDLTRLAPGCRTELVSHPAAGRVDGGQVWPDFGSRRWGLLRSAKGGSFPFVSLVGVAVGGG
ncbi:hypothetical protein ACQJBY_003185 [Aegilops geniculata]